MYAAQYVFSSRFFVAWVVISIIWVWLTMIVAGFFPIIDGWGQVALVFRGLLRKKEDVSASASASASDCVEVVESKGLPDNPGSGSNTGSKK